uniref:C-type mannose receptor 2 n=1 Tax=Nomascus leucogenys TaxID=61853 RepID=G1QXE8_NOMLE
SGSGRVACVSLTCWPRMLTVLRWAHGRCLSATPVIKGQPGEPLHGLQGCLEAQGGQVRVTPACNTSLPAQRWKWVSRNRLFNLGTMQCLGTGWPGTNTTASLGMYECDREALNLRWHCRTLGDQLSLLLGARTSNISKPGTLERGDQTRSGQWRIYGSEEDLCALPYHVYTIQGNSHGKPCTIPFKYDNQWFHGCTSTGREDGHLWCATTQDYGKDERWGFCPIKSNDCETFWDKDQLTDSCYQFNFQSTLSWREAWASCEQQGADLLSITEIHEQTYINGLLTGYSSTLWIGLNDLDTSGGWQWSDNSPLKYLNWESDQPDNPSEENCGVIRTESSGGWQNRDCSIALPYVCKKKPNATAEPIPPDRWANVKVECEPSWQPFQGHCYRLQAEKRSWQESKKACLRGGGDLVSIHSMAELEFITKQIKQEVEELWIGLNDLKLQMNFEWSDGSLVSFTHWHPFEPNNFRDSLEDCVTIWGPSYRSPCNQSLPSICKKAGQLSQGAAEEDHGCRKGWTWHSPSCYWLGEDQVTYSEARRLCTDHSSQLVTITNRFEQAFVSSLIYNWEGEYFWTALQDLNSTGSFRWLSGDEVMYTHWNRDQPGYSRGGCVALATGSAMGLWEVKNCTSFRARYICRQSLGTPVTPELPGPDPTPSLTGSCPQGWASDPKLRYCYKVFSSERLQDKKSWVQELGAQLLSLASYEEEHFVANMLNKIFGESEPEIHEQHWFWIGLNRRDPRGGQSWRWSDGLRFSYHNFDRSRGWLEWRWGTRPDDSPQGEDRRREWLRFQEAEYKFFEHHSTWAQAQRICTWFQAELTSVHSQAELDFLGHNLQKVGIGWSRGLQAGGGQARDEGRGLPTHTCPPGFSSSPGPRSSTGGSACTPLRDWGDQRCLTALPYICKRSNITKETQPPDLPTTALGGCPSGWIQFLTSRVKWSEAQFSCEQQEAQLVTITNPLEQALISASLPNVTFDLWIGLHASQRDFQWVEQEPLRYSNWAPGEPSGPSPAPSGNKPTSCAVVLHSPSAHFTGRWDDRSCTEETHGFICQKGTDPSLSPSPAALPPAPGTELSYLNGTFRLLQKPLRWHDALLLCESRNASLAYVPDPYTQAFLTQAARGLPLGGTPGSQRRPPPPPRISYHGSCPQGLADSAWIPFREHCYSFHMELLLGHKEARQRCQRAGGAVLSILDEMENVFVWEHLQSYEGQSRGAWLGMNFNPKGGTLVWQDNTAVNYSNWGPPGLGPSMLSHNSCYWIQSNSGLWRPGACSNITMGVVCKLPRGERQAGPRSASFHPVPLVLGWGWGLLHNCRGHSRWEGLNRPDCGQLGPPG